MKEQIKALAAAKSFTAEEKEFLKSTATKLGLEFTVRKGCRNCYTDLAVQIYNELLKAEPQQEAEAAPAKYKLKPGVDVQIGYPQGRRLNAATITDEWAEQLIARGLTKYFEDAN